MSLSPTYIDIQSFRHRRFRWRGAAGTLFLVPAAIVTLFTPPFVAGDSLAHVALQTVGWISFVAGATFRFWATLYIGGRKERDLVTEGPYSLCRHPLYLGSLLLGISAAFFLESPVFLASVVAVGGVYIQATIPVEEAVLRAKHATSYQTYCQSVPRLVPRSLVVQSPGQISVDVHRLWLEWARASRWVWLPIVGVAMNHFRALAWWPKFFRVF